MDIGLVFTALKIYSPLKCWMVCVASLVTQTVG